MAKYKSLDKIIDAMSNDGAGIPSEATRATIAKNILNPIRNHKKAWAAVKALENGARLVCIQANRRASKTYTIIRYLLAKCLLKKTHVVILTKYLPQPTNVCLDNMRDDCLVEILKQYDLYRYVRFNKAQNSIKKVIFAWGSTISVVAADTEGDVGKERGTTADLFWADEAQEQPQLVNLLQKLIGPMLGDTKASIILTGTPGEATDSFFRRVSLGLEKNWVNSKYYSWDNPFYGDDPESRWQRVVQDSFEETLQGTYGLSDQDIVLMKSLVLEERLAIADQNTKHLRQEIQEWLKNANPDLIREYFGAWIVSTSEYVISWQLPDLYWLKENKYTPGDYGIGETLQKRFELLPHHPLRNWYCAIGVDIGVNDPSAWVVFAYANNHNIAYELWSEKESGLMDHQTFGRLEEIVDEIKGIEYQGKTLTIGGVIADNKGSRKGSGQTWDLQLRSRVPSGCRSPRQMRTADRVKAFNLDLGARRIKLIKGSPLDIEITNLKYRPKNPEKHGAPEIWKERQVVLPDGRTDRPGDHALDATLYLLQDLDMLWSTEPEPAKSYEEAIGHERASHKKKLLSGTKRNRFG